METKLKGNAVANKKNNFDRYYNEFPHTTLKASGLDVGLPDGQIELRSRSYKHRCWSYRLPKLNSYRQSDFRW